MGRPSPAWLVAGTVVALLLPGLLPSATAATFPALPLADDGRFLTNLSAPVLAPGGSGTIAFDLSDPLSSDLLDPSVSMEIYRFNAYPGNATGPVPGGALTLSYAGSSGPNVTVRLATVVRGAPAHVELGVAADGGAPSGTYAIRFTLEFVANGSDYALASRGVFSDAAWAAATAGPNGTSTLNLSKLGYSGVVPETAVLVRSNPFPEALAVILGAALLLGAAGGYYAYRGGPGSRSGAVTPEAPSHAPTAFGKRRSKDGD